MSTLGTFFGTNVPIIFTGIFWLFITLKKELVMSKCMTNPNFCEKRFSSVDGISPMFMHGKKIRRKLPLLFFKDLDHEKLDDIWHIQIKIYYSILIRPLARPK